jgi:hypothetical protein
MPSMPSWNPAEQLLPPPHLGSLQTLYDITTDLVGDAERYAEVLIHQAALTIPVITPSFPVISNAPSIGTIPMPTLRDVVWTVPVQPAPFDGNVNIDPYLPGPFTGAAPTVSYGSAPTTFNEAAPDAPPIDLNFVYPEVEVTLPSPPSLISVSTVPFDGVTIPSFESLFDADVTELTAVAPAVLRYVEGEQYTSALLTQVEADINRAITDGTWTGLHPDAETAIWDRGREREYRQMADSLAELDRMESMGFALPPGGYVDARVKMTTELNKTIAGLSREILVKQAEMQLDNVQKARTLAVQLESQLITYANSIAQRGFDATKMVNDVQVELYNAQVRAYTARLEAYKTEAEIYRARIQGLQVSVEVYKAQVEAERVKAEINTSLVQQYKVQVDASLAQIEIYKGKIAIIQTQAEIEKVKIGAYSAQIQAFTGKISAYAANVDAYRSTIQVEQVKQEVFRSQVQAYTAQVEAGVKTAEAKIEEFKGRIAAYTGQLEGYKASVQGMIGQAQAAGAYNQAAAEVYRAEVGGLSSYNEVLTAQWKAVIDIDERIAEIGIKAAEANAQLQISARQITTDAIKTAAQVTAQLGSAALNAVHFNDSTSYAVSNSSSNSASDNQNFNASV